jgi:hypothetical protein
MLGSLNTLMIKRSKKTMLEPVNVFNLHVYDYWNYAQGLQYGYTKDDYKSPLTC